MDVVSVKREEKPAAPDRAVRVELRVNKEQAALIERAKARMVTVVEVDGGKGIARRRPVPLRLVLLAPPKE